MNRTFLTVSLLWLAATASAQWVQTTPANTPGGRSGPSLCFDPVNSRVLMYGGHPGGFGSPANTTWSWDGSTWTQVTTTANAHRQHQGGMVWDTNRGVALLYGGANTSFFGGPSVDQTWEFNGTTWTRLFPTTTPGGLALFGMAHDPVRNRTVVYGGLPDNFFPIDSNQTWEFDGFNWNLMSPANNPGPLERPAMCFHGGMNKIVLFGGIDVQIGGTNDTWTYDGVNWTVVPVTGARPSARTGPKMVYDAARNVCVMQGGMDPMTGTPFTDTWEFNGTSWTPITVPGPGGRLDAAMVYDTARARTVLFGGGDPLTGNAINQTWLYGPAYTAFGSGCAGSNGVPAIAAQNGAPRVGSTFQVSLTNLATGSSFALMFTGLSNSSWALGALPADLSGFGMPGCTGYTSAELLNVVAASGGTATWSFVLPPIGALVGATFHNQAGSLDATANAAGIAVSAARTGVIGN